MNGQLYNNDNGLYYRCLNRYKVTFNDGTTKYIKARNPFQAEEIARWFGDIDRYDDIVSVEIIE